MQGIDPIVIILGILIAVAVFLLYLYRDYLPIGKAKKSNVEGLIQQLLDKIRQLARNKDYNKASLLVWKTFTVATDGLLGRERAPNVTARQFALSLTEFDAVTEDTVRPLFELFEAARYGRDPVSLQEFNAGLTALHRYLQTARQISQQLEQGGRKEEAAEEFPEEEAIEEAVA